MNRGRESGNESLGFWNRKPPEYRRKNGSDLRREKNKEARERENRIKKETNSEFVFIRSSIYVCLSLSLSNAFDFTFFFGNALVLQFLCFRFGFDFAI